MLHWGSIWDINLRLILSLGPANKRRRYFVTTSLIGRTQARNQLCQSQIARTLNSTQTLKCRIIDNKVSHHCQCWTEGLCRLQYHAHVKSEHMFQYSWPIFYLRHGKVSTYRRSCNLCNVFSHWQRSRYDSSNHGSLLSDYVIVFSFTFNAILMFCFMKMNMQIFYW